MQGSSAGTSLRDLLEVLKSYDTETNDILAKVLGSRRPISLTYESEIQNERETQHQRQNETQRENEKQPLQDVLQINRL